MNVEEFKKRMAELGWTEEYIHECIDAVEKAKHEEVSLPYEMYLTEAPIDD